MSVVWPFHRRHEPEPTPVMQAAAALTSLARDLQTAANRILEQHPPIVDNHRRPPPSGAQR